MKNSYSRHITYFTAGCAITLLIYGMLAFFLDPYQVFHDQWKSSTLYSTRQRYQTPGLIRQHLTDGTDYDTIVVGTSMTMGFHPSDVSKAFVAGQTLHLAQKGASPREIGYVLRAALETGQVRNVLMDIHIRYAFNDKDHLTDTGFPTYLYEGLPIKYLFDTTTLEAAYELLTGNREHWKTDLETLNYSGHQDKETLAFNADENIDRLRENLRVHRERQAQRTAGQASSPDALEAHLLRLIRQHPETNFVCYFPPYSLYYLAMLPPKSFDAYMSICQYAVEALAPLPNAEVYGFSPMTEITGNLANYWNETHFSTAVSQYILDSVKDKRHSLTPENWGEYRNNLTKAVQAYRVFSDPNTALTLDRPIN